MRTNYEVDHEKEIIVVNMKRITESQMKVVLNYRKMGYKFVEYKPSNKNNDYTADTIRSVLEKKPELLELFEKVCNEVVIDKETGKPKTKKDGTVKVKGHIAGVKWYKDNIKKDQDTDKINLDNIDVEALKKTLNK